jgi:opacity protein-like surface antigen
VRKTLILVKWMQTAIVSAFFVWTVIRAAPVHSQTSVAASLYGAFSEATSGNGVQQSPSNAAGVMFELRHIHNPLFGYEATYSYNRANQTYSFSSPPPCPAPECAPAAVSANAHEIAGNWIASLPLHNLHPFALAGVGLILNVPANSSISTSASGKAAFVYGAGLDWGLPPHLGLRLQYRGNLYNAPELTRLYTSTGSFTHTAEPMIGAYLNF